MGHADRIARTGGDANHPEAARALSPKRCRVPPRPLYRRLREESSKKPLTVGTTCRKLRSRSGGPQRQPDRETSLKTEYWKDESPDAARRRLPPRIQARGGGESRPRARAASHTKVAERGREVWFWNVNERRTKRNFIGQAMKGFRWMPRHQEAKKDVGKPRYATVSR